MTDVPDENAGIAMEQSGMEGAPRAVTRYAFRFEGTGKEYFRIWIVNTFLTIVTLGIYAAWAKVRTRRYFYSNTLLAGHSFEFLGDPRAILKGNLIMAAGAVLYYVLKDLLPVYTVFVVMAFYAGLPFLIYKSFRFNARNTAYRNIRFHFLGSLKESYKVYLLWPLLIPPTLGLIFPYWSFRKKKYFFCNLSYGTTQDSFTGRPGPFYRAYMSIFALGVGVMVFLSFFVTTFIPVAEAKILRFAAILFPAVWVLLYLFLRQHLYVRLNNYCLACSAFGAVTFESTLWSGGLIWVYFTNILAIIFSAGLLVPWAKVRRTRYILENITVLTTEGLDDFTAASEGDVGALGDAATDFFDIAIGL